MAKEFGLNMTEAQAVAGRLNWIRDRMNEMNDVFNAYDGEMGSGLIEKALEDFYSESSDSRKKISEMLDTAHKKISGIATDTEKADQGYTKGREK